MVNRGIDGSLSGGDVASGMVSLAGGPSTIEAGRNSLMEAILDASFDGLCILDAAGCLLEVNAAFERLTGITRSESVGRNISELKELAFKAHWHARHSAIQQVLQGVWPASTLVNIKDDEMMLVTANPHFGPDGQILHIILNVRNITKLMYLKYELELGRGQAKLVDLDRLRAGYLQSRLKAAGLDDVVIESPVMNKIVSTIVQIADFDTSILLEGDTGTGKGILANFVHRLSRRAEGPFIEVNCGALPENLVESELYGYQPGAFTGSLRAGKKGQFELANGGTIFLDEISELPLNSQTKLLKFLDDKVIHPLGGTASRRVDVRIVAATNKNLRELASAGQFRKDLLYRLEVIPLYVPALRERREDLKALLYSFVEQYNKEFGLNRALGSEALRVLQNYDYPGNIRELKNLMARLVLTASGLEITVHDLPEYIRKCGSQPAAAVNPSGQSESVGAPRPQLAPPKEKPPANGSEPQQVDLREKLEETERLLLARYAQQCHSTYELADRLGISQSSIVRKLGKYGILLQSQSNEPPKEPHSRDFGLSRSRGSDALHVLLDSEGGGDVAELKKMMARLVLSASGVEITVQDLPELVEDAHPQPPLALAPLDKDDSETKQIDLREQLDATERRLLAHYAGQCRSTYELADRLGVSQSSIIRKLAKHGISLLSRPNGSPPEPSVQCAAERLCSTNASSESFARTT